MFEHIGQSIRPDYPKAKLKDCRQYNWDSSRTPTESTTHVYVYLYIYICMHSEPVHFQSCNITKYELQIVAVVCLGQVAGDCHWRRSAIAYWSTVWPIINAVAQTSTRTFGQSDGGNPALQQCHQTWPGAFNFDGSVQRSSDDD